MRRATRPRPALQVVAIEEYPLLYNTVSAAVSGSAQRHALGPDACARPECTSVFCTMQSLHPFERHSLESDACFRASIFSTRALEFGLEL